MSDINDHIHGEPFVSCKNPECPERPLSYIRLPLANPPRIDEPRKTTPLDGKQINYICRTCHHLSIFGSDDVHWIPTIDKVQDLSDFHTALWKIRYQCGQQNCDSRVEVFVSAESDYRSEEILAFLLRAKQVPVCANGHADFDNGIVLFVGIALTL